MGKSPTFFYSVMLDKTQREVDWSFWGSMAPSFQNCWPGKGFSQNSRGWNPLCVICLWQPVLQWMPSLVTEANLTGKIFLIEDYTSSHCFLLWIFFVNIYLCDFSLKSLYIFISFHLFLRLCFVYYIFVYRDFRENSAQHKSLLWFLCILFFLL